MKYSPQQNRKNEGKRRKQWRSFSGVWSVAWQKMPLFAFVLQRRSEIPPYTGLFLLLRGPPKAPSLSSVCYHMAEGKSGGIQPTHAALLVIFLYKLAKNGESFSLLVYGGSCPTPEPSWQGKEGKRCLHHIYLSPPVTFLLRRPKEEERSRILLSPLPSQIYIRTFSHSFAPRTQPRELRAGKEGFFFIVGRPLKAEVTKVLLSLFPPINRPLLRRKRKCGLKKRRRRGKVIFRLLPSSFPSRSNSRLARARGKEKN